MALIKIIYVLLFIIVGLIAYAVMQIKLAGMNVKDFWSFVEANQTLDKLYQFSKKYEKLSVQQQIIYLKEADFQYSYVFPFLIYYKIMIKCMYDNFGRRIIFLFSGCFRHFL